MTRCTNKFEKLLANFLADNGKGTKRTLRFDLLIVALILVSSVIFVAETYSLSPEVMQILTFVDVVIILLFTIEYFARVYVAHPRKKYIFSWLGIVDFIAFLPFWLSFFIPWVHTLQFLRVLRVFKLFRFFKLHLNKKRVKAKDVARILISKMLFVVFVLLFVSSALIYTLESQQNPNINTFDDAAYFSVVTVTTVGFGDITPVTRLGRMAIMFMIMFGILLIPVYVASLMRTYILHSNKRHINCSSCGLKLHDPNALHCKMCGKKIYQEHED